MAQVFTPVQLINDPFLLERGVRLYVKRDDYLGVHCQGVKYRKLKYIIEHCKESGIDQILSFGGMFSSHLYALAAAGHKHQLKTIGILQGVVKEWNPFTNAMLVWGMDLHPVTRSFYNKRNNPENLAQLKDQFPRAYFVTEESQHKLPMRGVGEIVQEVTSQIDFKIDHWAVPYFTGGTAIGIAKQLGWNDKLHLFILRRGLDARPIVKNLTRGNWLREKNVGFYKAVLKGSKKNKKLEKFITDFYEKHNIKLDPFYTGKMFKKIYRNVEEEIYRDCNILALHTGGYVSISIYNFRFRANLQDPLSHQILSSQPMNT